MSNEISKKGVSLTLPDRHFKAHSFTNRIYPFAIWQTTHTIFLSTVLLLLEKDFFHSFVNLSVFWKQQIFSAFFLNWNVHLFHNDLRALHILRMITFCYTCWKYFSQLTHYKSAMTDFLIGGSVLVGVQLTLVHSYKAVPLSSCIQARLPCLFKKSDQRKFKGKTQNK